MVLARAAEATAVTLRSCHRLRLRHQVVARKALLTPSTLCDDLRNDQAEVAKSHEDW